MAFKIKREGVAYEERHPVKHFFTRTGKTIFGASVPVFLVGTAEGLIRSGLGISPSTAFETAGFLGLVGIIVGVGTVVSAHTGEEGRKHYFFRFYANKYDKKGVIVSARNKEEASSIYFTLLLKERGYTKSEIKSMNQLEIIDALNKKKAK